MAVRKNTLYAIILTVWSVLLNISAAAEPAKGPLRVHSQNRRYFAGGPGKALDGKLKFDLARFQQAYFDRLRRRVAAAGKRGIYVSVMLFQGFSIEQKGTAGDGRCRKARRAN